MEVKCTKQLTLWIFVAALLLYLKSVVMSCLQSYHKLQVEVLKAESHAILGLFTEHPLFLCHVMHALTFPFTHSMMLLWFKMNATSKVTTEDAMLWHSCLVSSPGVVCCATHFIHSRMMLGLKLKRKLKSPFGN